MSRLEHVLQVGVHFKRPREGEAPAPRKTYKWGDYYELDEPPLEEDDAYMRDIEGYGPWYTSMDADGPRRAKAARDAYVRKTRARRAAEAAKQRKTFEWRGYELDAPPLVEDAAYREDVEDCPVKYMCLDSEGPKRFKETRDQWVRDKRARRADEAVPAYPDDAEQPRQNYIHLGKEPEPQLPQYRPLPAFPVEPEPPQYNTWGWGYDDEPEPPRYNAGVYAGGYPDDDEPPRYNAGVYPEPPEPPRYRPMVAYDDDAEPPRYKHLGAVEEDFDEEDRYRRP